jgi:branched-chain amino acid aminotransferase
MFCVLNGALTALAQATIPVTDRGFLYGETLFETMRAHAGRIALWERHVTRLVETADRLGFVLPYGVEALRAQCDALLAANGGTGADQDAVIRLTLSRGQSARGLDPADAHDPAVLLTCSALPPGLAAKARSGYRVGRATWHKPGARAWPLFAKTGNYLHSVLARQSAGPDVDEALLFDDAGNLAEGSFSNVFLVRANALYTPSLQYCLPGVARAEVLALARAARIPVHETSLDEGDLASADEVFLTNAVRGPMPVIAACEHEFAAKGPITAQLLEAWGERTSWPEFALSFTHHD